jgi:hypothetical protein
MKKLIFGLFAFLLASQSLRAEMIIAVTNGASPTFIAPGSPGSINQVDVTSGPGTVQLSVWAYDTAPASRAFNAFNLAFDLAPINNINISPNFSSFAVSNAITGVSGPGFNVNVGPTGRAGFDFVVSSSVGTSATLAGISTPVKLFDLSFTAAAATPAGLYDLRFAPAGTLDGGIFGPQNVNAVSFTSGTTTLAASGGQFQITAVPEPSSMALMGIFGLGVVAARRFRKHRSV